MNISGSVALVSGASRGLGRAFARVAGQCADVSEAGQVEVLADERTRNVKASLSRDHELIYPPVQEFWDAAVTGSS